MEDEALTNCMQKLVHEEITRRLETGDLPIKSLCTCSCCRMDVEMEALNRLPSLYVLSGTAGECAAGDLRLHMEIAAAVSRALEIIAKRGHIAE